MISWKFLLEPPHLIMINVIIMHHIQYSRTVYFFFTNLSTHLNCNGLLKVKCAISLRISNFLTAAVEKRRDAVYSLSRAEQYTLLRSQLKEKTHQRLLSFSLISNKGGPTGKGTQTGGNPCPPVYLG